MIQDMAAFSGSRALQLVATMVMLAMASCATLHQAELVPAATAGGAIQARVVSQATAGGPWFVAYGLVLRNASSAPVEIDLGAAQLSMLSMFDGTTVTARAVDGGEGELPRQRPAPAAPARISLSPGETRTAWVAFGGKLDPRARWSRRETLSLPPVGDILLDDRGPDHPEGIRQLRARRFAISWIARASVDTGRGSRSFAVPYDLGVGASFGDLRVDLHGGEHDQFKTSSSVITKTSMFAVGPGVFWRTPHKLGFYTDIEYVYASSMGTSGASGLGIGGGVGLPLWSWNLGSQYRGWRIPVAQLRLGWVETIASGGSSGALRIGLEISPAWLP